jgi:hypothetical protein
MNVRSREEAAARTADAALWAATVLALLGLGVILYLRYQVPPVVDHVWSAPPPTAAGLGSAPDLSVATAATTVAESLGPPPDSASAPPPPAPPAAVTDVVLLPCTEPNPRPDGRFLIPPHDPAHRTIVGLPSAPGEPRRGLVIPPHDPARENRIPLELVPLDSVLEHTIRLPPHDPSRYKLIRPDSLPCIDS